MLNLGQRLDPNFGKRQTNESNEEPESAKIIHVLIVREQKVYSWLGVIIAFSLGLGLGLAIKGVLL